jgi:hypothetical protein
VSPETSCPAIVKSISETGTSTATEKVLFSILSSLSDFATIFETPPTGQSLLIEELYVWFIFISNAELR